MSANRTVVGSAALALALIYGAADVQAQGCVASRIDAPSSCPSHDSLAARDTDGQGYHLKPGRWQASFGYRWFRSHRHFVGSVEQNAENVARGIAERDRSSSEVINHTHIPAISLSYGLSNRVSLGADLPIFIARRKSPGNATRPMDRTEARGIGDLTLMGRYWIGNPTGFAPQNLQVGLGIKMPTGNDKVEDDFLVRIDSATGARITERRPVDQSIQPGDGGWGIVAEFQAFKAFGRVTAFAAGNYLSNPREQNDWYRNPFATNQDPVSGKLSIADQYSGRVGLGTAFGKVGLSLGARLEGVPSSDLIGGDLGRRRPGYSVAIEPGVSYTFGKSAINLSVPYLVRRVRTQNISDKLASIASGHKEIGDAAFADYVVMVGFSRRF
jgi:hypothetical protein